MKRARLKSRSGCQKCKDRRRKCDEIKPVCGDCARLQFVCSWAAPDQPPLRAIDRARRSIVFTLHERDSGTASSSWELLNTTQNAARLGDRHGRVFDSPSILRTHAVPDDGTAECKHILQYLNEKGTVMLKLPAERLPPDHDHNLFRAAFGLASREPVLLQSHLCLSAGHLCRIHPSYEGIALKYYNIVLSKLRGELAVCVDRPPAEWACGVAAVLSFYEVRMPTTPMLNRVYHANLAFATVVGLSFPSKSTRPPRWVSSSGRGANVPPSFLGSFQDLVGAIHPLSDHRQLVSS